MMRVIGMGLLATIGVSACGGLSANEVKVANIRRNAVVRVRAFAQSSAATQYVVDVDLPRRKGECLTLGSDLHVTVDGDALTPYSREGVKAGEEGKACVRQANFHGTFANPRAESTVRIADATGTIEVTAPMSGERAVKFRTPADGKVRPGQPVELDWQPAADKLAEGTHVDVEVTNAAGSWRADPASVSLYGGTLRFIAPAFVVRPTDPKSFTLHVHAVLAPQVTRCEGAKQCEVTLVYAAALPFDTE